MTETTLFYDKNENKVIMILTQYDIENRQTGYCKKKT